MPYTAPQIKAAIATVLANQRDEVVKSWANETDREKREQLWLKNQLLESIEECIQHDFESIIRLAAGESGAGD